MLLQVVDDWVLVGNAASFAIRDLQDRGGGLLELIRIAWPAAPSDALTQYRIVLAIDAPLGFPVAFRDLLLRKPVSDMAPDSQIGNLLAHREAERWILKTFKKRALSASFDKLGNNATVAMYYAARWSEQATMAIVPFQQEQPDGHVIIEVYPALVKKPGGTECYSRFQCLLPDGLQPGTDEYDAAICAVLASIFASPRPDEGGDPATLVGPPEHIDDATVKAEGWIYTIHPEWHERSIALADTR